MERWCSTFIHAGMDFLSAPSIAAVDCFCTPTDQCDTGQLLKRTPILVLATTSKEFSVSSNLLLHSRSVASGSSRALDIRVYHALGRHDIGEDTVSLQPYTPPLGRACNERHISVRFQRQRNHHDPNSMLYNDAIQDWNTATTIPKLATNSDRLYWLASVYCSTRPHNLPIHSNSCFHLSGMVDSFSFENCDTEQTPLVQYLQLKCCCTFLASTHWWHRGRRDQRRSKTNGSFAWIICSSPCKDKLILNAVPVDGRWFQSQSSLRSEAAAPLASFTLYLDKLAISHQVEIRSTFWLPVHWQYQCCYCKRQDSGWPYSQTTTTLSKSCRHIVHHERQVQLSTMWLSTSTSLIKLCFLSSGIDWPSSPPTLSISQIYLFGLPDETWDTIAWDPFVACSAQHPAGEEMDNWSKLFRNWLNMRAQCAKFGVLVGGTTATEPERWCPYCLSSSGSLCPPSSLLH